MSQRQAVFAWRCLHIPLGASRGGGQRLVQEASGLRRALPSHTSRCFTQWRPTVCPRGKRSSQGVAFTYLLFLVFYAVVAGSLSKRQAVFALRCFRVSTHTKWLLCWGAMGKGISAPLLWCLGLLCWGASGTPIPCTRPYCRGQQCHWLALARWWGALQAHRQWLQRPNMFGLQLGRPVCLSNTK